MRPKKTGVFLFLILLIFFAKGIYFILLIPPWEAPDEGGHVKYVTYLYINKKIPNLNSSGETNSSSIEKSRTFQTNVVLPAIKKQESLKDVELFDRSMLTLERSVDNITFYPPLYYLYLMPFYEFSNIFSSYTSVVLMRIGSLILATISLFIVYKTAVIFFPKSGTYPLIVTFLVALQPMFTFVSSIVNNDSLVILLFLSFIYLGVRILSNNAIKYNLLMLSAATSLSAITKPQLLILIPLFGLVLINKIKNKKKLLFYFASSLIIPLIWYIPINHLSFSKAISAVGIYPDFSLIWKYPFAFLANKQISGIFITFWGDFGWLNVPMPKWIYILFLLLIFSSVVGWTHSKLKLGWKLEKNLFVVSAIILLSSVILFFDILHLINIHLFSIQGRYFLPLLPFFMIFLIKGVIYFEGKLTKFFLILYLSIFICSQILMYSSISNFYYGRIVFIPPLIQTYK